MTLPLAGQSQGTVSVEDEKPTCHKEDLGKQQLGVINSLKVHMDGDFLKEG